MVPKRKIYLGERNQRMYKGEMGKKEILKEKIKVIREKIKRDQRSKKRL